MLMGTSKQNLAKARAGLEERGLISYSRSKSRGNCGQYTIHPFGQHQLTYQLTNELSNGLTSQFTNELTTYNIEDNKDKNISNHTACEKIKSLEELECVFIDDTQ